MSTQIYPNISDDEIKICEKLLSEGKLPHKFAMRVQTVLARAKKIPTQEIAKVLGLRATTISIYVKRFNSGGIDSLLHDKSRKPGKNLSVMKQKMRYVNLFVQQNLKMRHIGRVRL